MNPLPRRILQQLIADYGPTLLNDPARLDALLADLCAEHFRERFLLVHALKELNSGDFLPRPERIPTLGPRLNQRLQNRYGFSKEAAHWAVESWLKALHGQELSTPRSRLTVREGVETDRDALVAFYNATNGANWLNDRNWLSDESPDTWHGVSTDGYGRVSDMDLSWNQLSGSIPPELGNLFNLTELYLNGNSLSGPIPPELGSLSNLTKLSLNDNRLNGPIPPELSNLSKLVRLQLSGNQLSGPFPAELRNLPSLSSLDLKAMDRLEFDMTTTLPHQVFPGGDGPLIPTVKSVSTDRVALVALYNATNGANWLNNKKWLSAAPLDTWHGVTVDRNGRVTRLVLQNNKLSGPVPLEIGNLSQLAWMDLSQNQLSGSIPLELGNLANLAWMDLSQNQLSGSIPLELGNLTNLVWMDLSQNQLSGTVPPKLRSLPNLKALNIDDRSNRAFQSRSIPSRRASQSTPMTENDRDDREVLTVFYHATSGDHWRNNENWLRNAPLGTWYGVATDTNGRVVRLSLAFNRLSGSIPPQLGNLSSLKYLTLKHNRLSGSIPPQLGNLSNLVSLDLSHNQLSGPIPDSLRMLPKLKELVFDKRSR